MISKGKNYNKIHAEHQAISKLKRRSGHIKKVDLIVVRINKTNFFSNSKPCMKCLEKIRYMPIKKGYKIKNIYYSNEKGNIIKCKTNKLETNHISYGYR